ncbi:hypothetical protein EQV77_01995 [Halobacillus fulvus]|nr:hypothetical protein EQV77_01995 [Halobacillus fulvus]
MDIKNNSGFTLSETMISLLVLLLIISLSFPLFHQLRSVHYEDELAIRQLFSYLQSEINESYNITTTSDSISFMDASGRMILIEQYQNLIRRRVDRVGHEPLLQDVEHMSITGNDQGLTIGIQAGEDVYLEKQIIFPK